MKYICQIFGYVYDDAKEKVPFAELPLAKLYSLFATAS